MRCLTQTEGLTAKEIVLMREEAGVSQAEFARALDVTTDYVGPLPIGCLRARGGIQLVWQTPECHAEIPDVDDPKDPRRIKSRSFCLTFGSMLQL